MIDNEIPDTGFDRRHVGPHNAFLFRESARVGDMIAAVRGRQHSETDFRVSALAPSERRAAI